MTANEWIKYNLPQGKTTLSVDAVEILIKLAWIEAVKSAQPKPKHKSGDIVGPYAIEELEY